MPCTTLLVGKNASYDGSTIIARNEDSPAGVYCPKKFTVVQPVDQPRKYKSVISKVEIDLPDNPLRYTAMPNAVNDEGIWAASGINSLNVSMTATETITSNPRVLGSDPLVSSGIGEEDIVTITLPYIKSAKEGVKRLGELLKKYGTYEKNGIAFQDEKEIWWFETIGGHHFIARRVPDDAYVLIANQLGIDYFDFVDAYSLEENFICSKDLIDFIEDNHLNLDTDGVLLKENRHFDIRSAFGSKDDADRYYNTPRVWYAMRYFNPSETSYSPTDFNLPFINKAQKKITIEDIKEVLSSCYEDTEFNPYLKKGDLQFRGKFRPIGINRNNFLSINQIRPYIDKEYQCIEWIAMGSNRFNTILPFYTNVNSVPKYLENVSGDCKTDNFYWVNRLIGALSDASYDTSKAEIERYTLNTISLSHQMIKEADLKAKQQENISKYLESINQQIADMGEKLSQVLLNKVIKNASDIMKNSFSRSDA